MTSEQKKFIEDIAKYVKKYAPEYGVKCYSAIIAQAICESGWGKSSLSAKYHNYFGLKCGTLWKGGSVNMRTGEEYNGKHVTITDNFRTYSSMEEGVEGYFVFLFEGRTRYDNLKGVTDPETYLKNIKADGYATSSSYVNTNMNLVRTYDLTYYDPKETAKMKTNSGLVAYAKEQVGLPYWWGTFGQTATSSLLSAKRKQYPSYYTAGDFGKQLGKRVHDCIGLIKGYLWSETPTSAPKYNSSQDVTAQGMYEVCPKRGNIGSFDKVKGRLLFRGSSAYSIVHVGVYAGDGIVYEAKGHAYGVVKSDFSKGGWTHWGQCPWITCDTEGDADKAEKKEETVASNKCIVKDYLKAVGDSAEKTFKKAVELRCTHVSTGSWDEMVSKKTINCNGSGAISLQLAGCLAKGTKMGHVSTKGISPSQITSIDKAMYNRDKIKHCRFIWVNGYERDLPYWLKRRGVIYIQWSNCCVSAGMEGGKHWIWSCNEEGGYHSHHYDQYKETSNRSGVLSCGGHYPWGGKIFVAILPEDKWFQHYAVEAILRLHGDGDDRRDAFGKHYETIQAFVNRMVDDEPYFLRWAADYVLEGYAGDGEHRKRILGKWYDKVQSKVKWVTNKAHMCWRNEIPSGDKRKEELGKDYEIVQKQVNRTTS